MKIGFEDLKRYLTASIIEDAILIIKALATLILNLRFQVRNLVGDGVYTAINENVNTQVSLKIQQNTWTYCLYSELMLKNGIKTSFKH